jgi:hypothetical protein
VQYVAGKKQSENTRHCDYGKDKKSYCSPKGKAPLPGSGTWPKTDKALPQDGRACHQDYSGCNSCL